MDRSAYVSLLKCQLVLSFAAREGLRTERLYRLVDLDPGTEAPLEGRIEVGRYFALWEAVMRARRDPGAPVRAGTSALESHGLIGFTVMTSATIGDALDRGLRLQPLWTNRGYWEREDRSDALCLRWRPWSRTGAELGERCACEYASAQMLSGLRQLVDRAIGPTRARFGHRAPEDLRAHQETFGAQALQFDAGTYELEFSPEIAAYPVRLANRALVAYLESQCDELLRRSRADPPWVMRARTVLVDLLRHGQPTLESAAQRLGVSERTLHRVLSAEGASFTRLLDTTRAELAVQYLRDGRFSVEQVAELVGFRSVSAFHRAFKRWTGASPGRFGAKSPTP